MKTSWIKSFYIHIIFLAILSLAAFLRLYKISQYMTFLGDEGRDVLVVYNILHGHLTFLGPTASVGGFFMGPIYYYFMTPFLWLFNYNPVGPAIMVAIFSLCTIILIYKIGSEFFNKSTGLIASLLYAISPLAIAYSRSSWNPNLMPFFSILTLYLMYVGLKSQKKLFLILSGISMGIALQLHYTALFLGVICGLYILIERLYEKRNNVRRSILQIVRQVGTNYFVFSIGIIIGFSLFLAFEIRHGFPNIQSILKFILFSGETGGNSRILETFSNVFFRLFGRLATNFPPPEQISIQESIVPIDFFFFKVRANVGFLYYPTLLLAVASVGILVKEFVSKIADRKLFLQRMLILLWLFVGIFIFGFYKKAIYDYYFEFMFPLPFLLIANLLVFLFSQKKFLKITAGVVFILILLLNIAGIPFRYTANNQLDQVRKISEFVLSKTEGRAFNFALITGGNSDHGYRYFFELARHSPSTIQNTVLDPKRESVTDQLIIVCEINPCAPLGNSLWEVAGFGRAEIESSWDISVVKVYKLVHYKGS